MSELVLGLDQGTSSTRCLVLAGDLTQRGAATVPVTAAFPGPGLVEEDPGELAASAERAVTAALADAGAAAGDVAALGVANQTETFVVYERADGRPVHPAIVWQDRRTAAQCDALAAAGHAGRVRARTGLELDATFPATKLGWVLDHVPGARAAAERGELAYADVASWLLRCLAGAEVCDASNAGRSLLCPLGGVAWDDELLDLFGIPRALLPAIVDCDALEAVARVGGDELPLKAALGDQQASLLGLGGHRPGAAKVTLGTGAFILAQGGERPPDPPAGVLASCAWRAQGATSFALEGFVPAAGAALDWFASLGVLPPGPQLDALLGEEEPADATVACVPALQGLGTPDWDAGARGALLGLTRGTSRAAIAHAVVDGVLHQVADALEAIAAAMPVATVLLDGGMSRSDRVTRRLADLAGVQVRRAARSEATAIGAATLAGLAAGLWAGLDELPEVVVDLVAEPTLTAGERTERRGRWAEAVRLSAGVAALATTSRSHPLPSLQLDAPVHYDLATKRALARRLGSIYVAVMDTEPGIVTIAIRDLGAGGVWRCTDDEPIASALLMCDVRRGRPAEIRAELSRQLIAACAELGGLDPERVKVEFTQHAGDEMYHPQRGGFNRDWEPGERG